MITILGLIGAAGLIGFYLPQLRAIWRSPKLEGFSVLAWLSLLVGVSALATQLFLLQAWTGVAANAIGIAVILEVLRQIRRKQ